MAKHYNFALVEFHYDKDITTGAYVFNGESIFDGKRVALEPPYKKLEIVGCNSKHIVRCYPFNNIML